MEPQQVSPPIKLTFTPCGHVTRSGSEKSGKWPTGRPRPVLKELRLGSEGPLLQRGLTGRKGNNHKQTGVRECPFH